MSSIIEGYNYDIFISYRQKDNKGDKWVSKFVDSLKTELEATFKEDITVYFDENPHDRLQETHDVDKSLEGKLKCLIFIPILSQTYCDPNSYAWQREFLAFLRMTKNDSFGRNIKLRGGNVASRILPVRIHDLEPEDVKLYEKETGSVLRAVDFVFRTAASVNRPLQPEDNKNDNLNKTLYRDQVNKVANAIKEIVLGMKAEPVTKSEEKSLEKESFREVGAEEPNEVKEKPTKINKARFIIPTAVVILLIIAGIIAFPKLFKRDTLERLKSSSGKISIAVMPFQNLTNDTTWNVWGRGIQDILVIQFSSSGSLDVIQPLSINNLLDAENPDNNALITKSSVENVSKKLNANILISGSINQAGTRLRQNAQIISSKTGKTIQPFQLEGPAIEDNIFTIIDSLSGAMKDFLEVSHLKATEGQYYNNVDTRSPKAYREYIAGIKALKQSDWNTSIKHLTDALEIDSNLITAKAWLGILYATSFNPQGRRIFQELFEERENVPDNWQWLVDFTQAFFFIQTPDALKRFIIQYSENENQDPIMIHFMGVAYKYLEQYDDAIPEFERALEIYKDWKIKPIWFWSYQDPVSLYHRAGQYEKEIKLCIQAERDFPRDFSSLEREQTIQAIKLLTDGDTTGANQYIEKIVSGARKKALTESSIASTLAGIYGAAKMQDKKEEFLRRALTYSPNNAGTINTLASFLINNNRNINEGITLINKALEINPNAAPYLDTKGWGLYKLGKYKEALDFIQKGRDILIKQGWYDNSNYRHLEAAKKAVAEMKNN